MPRQNTANSSSQERGFSKIILLILGSFILSSLALVAALAIFNPLERLQPQNPPSQRSYEYKEPSVSQSPQPTFQKSEENDYFTDVASLPSCGSNQELFSISPLKLTDFNGIVPLGALATTTKLTLSQT